MNDELPTTLAGFKLALEFMGEQLRELKEDFRDFKQNYVPISEYLTLKEEVKDHSKAIEALKSWRDSSTGKIWGIVAAIGVVSGLVSFLVSNFYRP